MIGIRAITVLVALCFGLLAAPPSARAQEESRTPSQKTQEAVEKFKKAPATVAESLEALREAGKAQIEATLAPKADVKKPAPDLTLPQPPEAAGGPRYSGTGKRDPFRPFALKARAGSSRQRENLSPLERFDLGQLKLVGVVWDIKEPRAMVEDNLGLGYIVKIGTPIGPNRGKVKAIKPGEIVIEEVYVDFFGARKVREVSMALAGE